MAYFRTCHSQDLYIGLQDLDNHTGERDCSFTKSRWDLFFYILLWYWWNSTSEILADVIREAPSTTSFIDDSRITFFLTAPRIYSRRVVEGSVRCPGTRSSPRLHSMTGNQTRRQQQVHYLTFNLFSLLQRTRLEGSIEFCRHRRRSQC